MTCETCEHWQGTRYAVWADCYWVIGTLEPKLFKEANKRGYFFNVPFDPHDIHSFHHHSYFRELYNKVMKKLPKGVKVDKVKGLRYLRTRKDYYCEAYCPFNGRT